MSGMCEPRYSTLEECIVKQSQSQAADLVTDGDTDAAAVHQTVRPVPIADRAVLPVAALLQLMGGYWVSQCLHVVAHLRVADAMRDGPRHVSEVAAEVGASPAALYRVMRALATAEVFEERNGHIFALTPMSELLIANTPASVRGLALWHGASWHWG